MTNDREVWRVQLASGELRAMTLDALDSAFQSGIIDESTSVLAPGATSWAPLAVVAGMEDTAIAPPPVSSVAPMTVAASSEPIRLPAPVSTAAFAELPDVADLADDALRPKRSVGIKVAGVAFAAAAALAVAFAVPKLGAAVGNVHPAKDVPVANAVQAPAAAMDLPAQVEAKPQISDEVKKKLLETDKKRDEDRKAKRPAAPRGARSDSRANSSSPFVNGGDKFDPLNGSL